MYIVTSFVNNARASTKKHDFQSVLSVESSVATKTNLSVTIITVMYSLGDLVTALFLLLTVPPLSQSVRQLPPQQQLHPVTYKSVQLKVTLPDRR